MTNNNTKSNTDIDWNNNIISKFNGEYYFLSNFSPSIILLKLVINGVNQTIKCLTAEMAYQYGKAFFAKDEIGGKNILQSMSPKDSKSIGKTIKFKDNVSFLNWENNKYKWMYKIIELKFYQNSDLQLKLVSTFPKILVEGNTWNDKYWGYSLTEDCGSNNLGLILMSVRNQLINNIPSIITL